MAISLRCSACVICLICGPAEHFQHASAFHDKGSPSSPKSVRCYYVLLLVEAPDHFDLIHAWMRTAMRAGEREAHQVLLVVGQQHSHWGGARMGRQQLQLAHGAAVHLRQAEGWALSEGGGLCTLLLLLEVDQPWDNSKGGGGNNTRGQWFEEFGGLESRRPEEPDAPTASQPPLQKKKRCHLDNVSALGERVRDAIFQGSKQFLAMSDNF